MKPVKRRAQDILIDLPGRPGGAVKDIRDHLVEAEACGIDYTDMAQMAEIQGRFRRRVRLMIAHYRRWKIEYEGETDQIERVYTAYEGIFIRRQLADSWQLYLTVNRDYHEMRRVYLANLRQPPHRRAV